MQLLYIRMIFENQSAFNQLNNFVCLHVSNIFAFTVGFIQCSCNEHLLVTFIVKVTVCVFAFPARLQPMHNRVHRLTSTHHNVNSIFNALKIIVEQSHKREIKSRMSVSFMLLLFKVHIRNKSFQVPLARSESFYSLIIIDVVSL